MFGWKLFLPKSGFAKMGLSALVLIAWIAPWLDSPFQWGVFSLVLLVLFFIFIFLLPFLIHERVQAIRLQDWSHPVQAPLVDALIRNSVKVDRVWVSDELSTMLETRWGIILGLELIFSKNQAEVYALFQAPKVSLFRRIIRDIQTLLSTSLHML